MFCVTVFPHRILYTHIQSTLLNNSILSPPLIYPSESHHIRLYDPSAIALRRFDDRAFILLL